MPWQKVDTVDLRVEFVYLAKSKKTSITQLCQRYKISRKTGYKWIKRFESEGESGLVDRSRVPRNQPNRTASSLEDLVLDYRGRYPDWGGRKLARVMRNEGHRSLPAPSTITQILRRHDVLHTIGKTAQTNFCRFEHPNPNDLWQMDFKGQFSIGRGACHPLTILDDHSRFSLCLAACAYERQQAVKTCLISTFERYGLPLRMTMDNGPPWGSGAQPGRLTQLTAWLIQIGVSVSHSRPYHPQTQGKDERFHRTLKAELLGRRSFTDLNECQVAFDPWRDRYNTQRPHEALNLDTPADHYRVSERPYRANLPEYEYAPGDHVRKVSPSFTCSFKRYEIMIGKALVGKHVALRSTTTDGLYTIHFCHQQIDKINLHSMSKRAPS